MITTTSELLRSAETESYAVGAFNVYNLEGVKAVLKAAESEASPIILQVHPGALRHGGIPLVALCLSAAGQATVPVAVQLDHSTSREEIANLLKAGVSSVMADGSHLPFEANIRFTREIVRLAHLQNASVEAELGRLSGTEDGLSVAEYEARLTDPAEAADFIAETKVDALAVCIGNVHGHYSREPDLDFDRLEQIDRVARVPIVLHGASGLPEEIIRRSIVLGVRKINVNTEVREAYLQSLRRSLAETPARDLVDIMECAVAAMQAVVCNKIQLFGSSRKVGSPLHL